MKNLTNFIIALVLCSTIFLTSCNQEYIVQCSSTDFTSVTTKLEKFGIMPKDSTKKVAYDPEGKSVPTESISYKIRFWKSGDFTLTSTEEGSWIVEYEKAIGRQCSRNSTKIQRVWLVFPDKSTLPVDMYWDGNKAPKEIILK